MLLLRLNKMEFDKEGLHCLGYQLIHENGTLGRVLYEGDEALVDSFNETEIIDEADYYDEEEQ